MTIHRNTKVAAFCRNVTRDRQVRVQVKIRRKESLGIISIKAFQTYILQHSQDLDKDATTEASSCKIEYAQEIITSCFSLARNVQL